MTNDNFNDAARAEAERRYNRIARRNKTADEWLDEGRASGFTSGAEWARTRLAAQGPQVTIRHEEGEPSTCEVRQGGVLIFSGRDHSADLRVARAARRYEVTR